MTATASIPVVRPARLTRKQERKRLERALRIRDRRRRADAFAYRFRGMSTVLLSGTATAIVIIVGQLLARHFGLGA